MEKESDSQLTTGQCLPAPNNPAFRASVNHAVRAALWNFEKSGYTQEELADEIADILDPPRLQSVINSRAEIEDGLREAWKIIDVLYMDALDHNGDSWPRAREWQEKWARFKANTLLSRRPEEPLEKNHERTQRLC
jgi:hypothetical protein